MNSWKLNSIAAHIFRISVCKSLGIEHTEIYKEIKEIKPGGIIITKDGKEYILELKEKI